MTEVMLVILVLGLTAGQVVSPLNPMTTLRAQRPTLDFSVV